MMLRVDTECFQVRLLLMENYGIVIMKVQLEAMALSLKSALALRRQSRSSTCRRPYSKVKCWRATKEGTAYEGDMSNVTRCASVS